MHKEVVILREGTLFFFALCINNLDKFIICKKKLVDIVATDKGERMLYSGIMYFIVIKFNCVEYAIIPSARNLCHVVFTVRICLAASLVNYAHDVAHVHSHAMNASN